ncbi:ubiquinol oxidase subunit II [Burkholderia gladioli]|uniref:ubiquinol oxidase subunit II n=1 Tax=Burkholderia gladioli TaxID=28095 RepID=UPI00163EE464|nr:ubiquinol oxidase subunit II [Burkholderia gladioli]
MRTSSSRTRPDVESGPPLSPSSPCHDSLAPPSRAAAGRGRGALKALAPLARLAPAAGLLLLGGCSSVLMNPKGDIGVQEKQLILIALGLMLLVVIPVIALTLWFAWRYRASNRSATYAPRWSHSTAIEVVVWSIPCVIVVILAGLIWRTTLSLDPYKPIESAEKPVRVEVVALNWKWLFIYPDYGVASVNELAVPVGTPVDFRLTAESLMNSFFIPQLGTQVYAMPSMQTRLHLIADEAGTYLGQSAAFSGPGFSDMHFKTYATSRGEFDAWIARARAASVSLDAAAYARLAQPSEKNAPTLYASVVPDLFDNIVATAMRAGSANPSCTAASPGVIPATIQSAGAGAISLSPGAAKAPILATR